MSEQLEREVAELKKRIEVLETFVNAMADDYREHLENEHDIQFVVNEEAEFVETPGVSE